MVWLVELVTQQTVDKTVVMMVSENEENVVERLKDEEDRKEGQDYIPCALPLHALASLESFARD